MWRRHLLLVLVAGAVCPAVPAASQVELKVQLGHSESLASVAFSPDGRFVLTGADDHTARLWDVPTGREIRRFEGHSADLESVAFSPDGRSILTGSLDHTARLWDVATGREIRRFAEPFQASVLCAVFSPDGRWVLTGSGDIVNGKGGSVLLWDAATGQEIRRFEGHAEPVESVAFSPDGRLIASGGRDKTARVWDAATGHEIHRLEGYSETVKVVAFSPDGRTVLTASQGWSGAHGDNNARLWAVGTGIEVRPLEPRSDEVKAAVFSPDGRTVVTGGLGKAAQLWDVATGREIRRFEGHSGTVCSVAYSPDGRSILTGSWDKTARLWDVATGREIREFKGYTDAVQSVAYSPDGRFLLTGSPDKTARLWDLATGGEIRRFIGHTDDIECVAFSPDGRFVLTGSDGHAALYSTGDNSARLWDAATGREVRRFEGHSDGVDSVAFSPDGRSILTGSGDKTARLWDAATGREIRRFEEPNEIDAVAFSPDGGSIVTGGLDSVARLWDVATGQEIRRFEGNTFWIASVAFSPDGRSVLTGSVDKTARLWDAATGHEIRRFEGHTGPVSSVAFSPDGRSVLTGSPDKTARLWDVATGREVHRFEGHTQFVRSVAFSPNGRSILTGSSDGTSKIWDPASGRLLATLMSFRDAGWAVVDPEGRYDASDPDSSPGLYWQLGDDVIELRQLKSRFYAPDLLGRTLGFNHEPLARVAGLNNLQLWPAIQVKQPAPGESSATIRLTDRGGGIGRVVVKVNGREIPLATRGTPIQSDTPVPIDLSAAQLAANGDNTIEVIAYGNDNLVAARGVTVLWKKTAEKSAAPSVLHAILAGVSTYESPAMSLAFPAKDALDMAHALEVGGKRMFGVERIDIAAFASGASHEPTKENIHKAFETVASKAGPDDIVLIYLAGHGVAGKAGSDLYYYLTRDARTVNPADDAKLWEQTTISSAELLEWLRQKGMPLRQVVVLDTCAAGAAATELLKLADRRELTADSRRALELLKDATGSHILMGAAADKVSYEASRYGQGLLTYSLLLGMRGEALDEGGVLNVRKWFDTAQRRVPEFAQGIGGIQQPIISSPAGQTFPIALFTPEDRLQIVLAKIKPQLLRAAVHDDDDNDPLHLDGPVRAALRAASVPASRGEIRPEPLLVVYLDQVAGDVADAYVPQVRYQVNGNEVQIRLRLVSSADRQERNFSASTRDPVELAKRITDEFLQMLASLKLQ